MTIENKYGVPRETIKKMVDDGIISTSVVRHYDMYDLYKRYKSECQTCTEHFIMLRIADEMKYSLEMVQKVVYKLCKK
jgi:hypothetical protein